MRIGLENELIDASIRLHRMDPDPPKGVGATYAEFDGRFYQPAEHGTLLLLVGEFAGDELVDLLGWKPDCPQRVFSRTGIATVAGEDHLRAARFLNEPVLVHRTIEDYARAGQTGCCLFNSDFQQLISLNRILVDDLDLGERISAMHRAPPRRLPKILVRPRS